MKLENFLNKNNQINSFMVPSGNAATPNELYENCISIPYSSNPEKITNTIIKWHELLVNYANKPGAVLLSRLYESQKINDSWENRRNSLTLSKNYNYAFCSNHFARVILTMALNCFVPDEQDFWDAMVNKKSFYLGSLFGLTGVEKNISAYAQQKYDNKFYTEGWYLAHIISVNDMPFKNHESIDVKNIYKLGKKSDWVYDKKIGCNVRKNDDILNKQEKEVAIAHFLRCVDPINYFLVPNRNNVLYSKVDADDGSPLGENKFVVKFMLIKAYDRFGNTFIDFLENSLADIDMNIILKERTKIASTRINAQYGVGINASLSEQDYTSDEKLKVAAYYLKNHSSLVQVEKDMLNVSNKRGWVAKKILNDLGIITSNNSIHKGLLLSSTIDKEILKASGTFKNTLEEIRKRGL